VLKNVPTAEVDRFIKKVGPDFQNTMVRWLEECLQGFTVCFQVPVNYDEPDAIAQAIKAAKFDDRYGDVPTDEIPLVGKGQTVHLVYEVCFGEEMYSRGLPAALKERGRRLGFELGFKFDDPLTALRFAGLNPDQQIKYPLTILFHDSKGQLCYLRLGGGDTKRNLSVWRVRPDLFDVFWGGNERFLAVRELPSVV
jgi:hypothetical protein